MRKNIEELKTLEDRDLKKGDIVRHFKNKLYLIEGIAKHTEDGNLLMIYRALYGDFSLYARPLEMFLSEVDREKYPKVKQKYRLEKVDYVEFCNLNKEELTSIFKYVSDNNVKLNIY